mmetsp:Transcript_6204/g.16202  ORF Transcript_6204/g.16202 Transcript_6204/m.16202 type:complete len:247 (+) Transcript_6204:230-970(+)
MTSVVSGRLRASWPSTSTSERESSWLVASSSTSTRGRRNSARARSTRCRCPPDNRQPPSPHAVSRPSGSAFAIWSTPTAAAAAQTSASLASACSRMFSSRLRSKSLASCGTTATCARSHAGSSCSSDTPSSSTEPAEGWSSRASELASVDLPLPEAPTSAMEVPASIRSETPRSASGVLAPSAGFPPPAGFPPSAREAGAEIPSPPPDRRLTTELAGEPGASAGVPLEAGEPRASAGEAGEGEAYV